MYSIGEIISTYRKKKPEPNAPRKRAKRRMKGSGFVAKEKDRSTDTMQ